MTEQVMKEIHEGYLLITDITGYTTYLSDSELKHAQATLTALLELIVENTRSPLIITRLAGDAVISYGLHEDFFLGQTFIEKLEDTYVAFRKALERLVLNNTCRCNACANISNLDLKFFVHFGTFGIQRISNYDELVGNDINLLHRLLKNNVTDATGIRAYSLYTKSAIQKLGVEDLGDTMTLHNEEDEHLGNIPVFVQDMHPVWEKKRESTTVGFPYDRLIAKFVIEINMPRERVWDYLAQPRFRNILIGSDKMEVTNRVHGRITDGSVYQCYHGDKWVPHTILEWQPFERIIVKESYIVHGVSALNEYQLETTESGTRFTRWYAKPTGPFPWGALFLLLTPGYRWFGKKYLETFKLEIENDYRSRSVGRERNGEFAENQILKAAENSLHASSDGQNA